VQHGRAAQIDVDVFESDERCGGHRVEAEVTGPREFT